MIKSRIFSTRILLCATCFFSPFFFDHTRTPVLTFVFPCIRRKIQKQQIHMYTAQRPSAHLWSRLSNRWKQRTHVNDRTIKINETIAWERSSFPDQMIRRCFLPATFEFRPRPRLCPKHGCDRVGNSNVALFSSCIIGSSRQIERRSRQSTARVNLRERKSKLEAFVSGLSARYVLGRATILLIG